MSENQENNQQNGYPSNTNPASPAQQPVPIQPVSGQPATPQTMPPSGIPLQTMPPQTMPQAVPGLDQYATPTVPGVMPPRQVGKKKSYKALAIILTIAIVLVLTGIATTLWFMLGRSATVGANLGKPYQNAPSFSASAYVTDLAPNTRLYRAVPLPDKNFVIMHYRGAVNDTLVKVARGQGNTKPLWQAKINPANNCTTKNNTLKCTNGAQVNTQNGKIEQPGKQVDVRDGFPVSYGQNPAAQLADNVPFVVPMWYNNANRKQEKSSPFYINSEDPDGMRLTNKDGSIVDGVEIGPSDRIVTPWAIPSPTEGVYAISTPKDTWLVKDGEVVRSLNVGQRNLDESLLPPAIHFSDSTITYQVPGKIINADLADGKENWHVNIGNDPLKGTAFSDQGVYVQKGTVVFDGEFYKQAGKNQQTLTPPKDAPKDNATIAQRAMSVEELGNGLREMPRVCDYVYEQIENPAPRSERGFAQFNLTDGAYDEGLGPRATSMSHVNIKTGEQTVLDNKPRTVMEFYCVHDGKPVGGVAVYDEEGQLVELPDIEVPVLGVLNFPLYDLAVEGDTVRATVALNEYLVNHVPSIPPDAQAAYDKDGPIHYTMATYGTFEYTLQWKNDQFELVSYKFLPKED